MTIGLKLSVTVADFGYIHFAFYCAIEYKESYTPLQRLK